MNLPVEILQSPDHRTTLAEFYRILKDESQEISADEFVAMLFAMMINVNTMGYDQFEDETGNLVTGKVLAAMKVSHYDSMCRILVDLGYLDEVLLADHRSHDRMCHETIRRHFMSYAALATPDDIATPQLVAVASETGGKFVNFGYGEEPFLLCQRYLGSYPWCDPTTAQGFEIIQVTCYTTFLTANVTKIKGLKKIMVRGAFRKIIRVHVDSDQGISTISFQLDGPVVHPVEPVRVGYSTDGSKRARGVITLTQGTKESRILISPNAGKTKNAVIGHRTNGDPIYPILPRCGVDDDFACMAGELLEASPSVITLTDIHLFPSAMASLESVSVKKKKMVTFSFTKTGETNAELLISRAEQSVCLRLHGLTNGDSNRVVGKTGHNLYFHAFFVSPELGRLCGDLVQEYIDGGGGNTIYFEEGYVSFCADSLVNLQWAASTSIGVSYMAFGSGHGSLFLGNQLTLLLESRRLDPQVGEGYQKIGYESNGNGLYICGLDVTEDHITRIKEIITDGGERFNCPDHGLFINLRNINLNCEEN